MVIGDHSIRGTVMSKFNVGDVVQLLPTSLWADGTSSETYSHNPVGIDGTITYAAEDCYRIDWSNGKDNCSYTNRCLVLSNKNIIHVPLNTYESNSELSEEDKQVIKDYVKKNNL